MIGNPLPMVSKKSLARIYGTALKQMGVNYATAKLNHLKSDTACYYLIEQELNWLGYDLLYAADFRGHLELSLEAFKINTPLFPNSFNVYDSYGEGSLEKRIPLRGQLDVQRIYSLELI